MDERLWALHAGCVACRPAMRRPGAGWRGGSGGRFGLVQTINNAIDVHLRVAQEHRQRLMTGNPLDFHHLKTTLKQECRRFVA